MRCIASEALPFVGENGIGANSQRVHYVHGLGGVEFWHDAYGVFMDDTVDVSPYVSFCCEGKHVFIVEKAIQFVELGQVSKSGEVLAVDPEFVFVFVKEGKGEDVGGGIVTQEKSIVQVPYIYLAVETLLYSRDDVWSCVFKVRLTHGHISAVCDVEEGGHWVVYLKTRRHVFKFKTVEKNVGSMYMRHDQGYYF